MTLNDSTLGGEAGDTLPDLRQLIPAILLDRTDTLAADAVAVFPLASAAPLDVEYGQRISRLLIQLLAASVRDDRLDARSALVGDLHRTALERRLSINQIFSLAYLSERTALDELALHAAIGSTTEPWPNVAQLVRRASFDVLAAYAERARTDPTTAAIVDALTTLHTRPLFDAVLAREVERASRERLPVALILFDVDRLAAINTAHGFGVGDKILERLGILVRTYFRQHDWIARHADDAIAVLLTGADAGHAADLAERVRATVEERLGFVDHRTDTPVAVTITAAVVSARAHAGGTIDPERLRADGETAIGRAKRKGRNRVEEVDGSPASHTLPHSSPST
jgi:diguanylate cyclase (GGDEF)-like protein